MKYLGEHQRVNQEDTMYGLEFLDSWGRKVFLEFTLPYKRSQTHPATLILKVDDQLSPLFIEFLGKLYEAFVREDEYEGIHTIPIKEHYAALIKKVELAFKHSPILKDRGSLYESGIVIEGVMLGIIQELLFLNPEFYFGLGEVMGIDILNGKITWPDEAPESIPIKDLMELLGTLTGEFQPDTVVGDWYFHFSSVTLELKTGSQPTLIFRNGPPPLEAKEVLVEHEEDKEPLKEAEIISEYENGPNNLQLLGEDIRHLNYGIRKTLDKIALMAPNNLRPTSNEVPKGDLDVQKLQEHARVVKLPMESMPILMPTLKQRLILLLDPAIARAKQRQQLSRMDALTIALMRYGLFKANAEINPH